MKVLIVHPCKGFYGGAEEVVVQLAKYLIEGGNSVLLVSKAIPKGVYSNLKNEQHQLFNICEAKNHLDMCREVRKNLGWTDVVNVHNFPATLIPFPTRKPIVWMCNEPAELFTNWKRKPIEAFNRWWVRKSGMKAVVADEVQAVRFQDIYGVEPTVIPYGIDYKFWSQGERSPAMKLAFGLAHGKDKRPIKLLQVGTISPYKKQLASIIALAELLLDGIDAELTLVGGITDKRYYECLRSNQGYIQHIVYDKDLRLQDRINFLGQKSQEEVRDLYRDHDVLLHPVGKQGGWLVPFEAMCAGLPVITTPSFPASGFIVRHGLGAVTENMADSITSRHLKNFNTEEIKLWVRDNLTWEKFGESMIKVFEEAIV